MSFFRRFIFISAALVIAAPMSVMADETPHPAEAAEPLSAAQLSRIYRGRTWVWPQGAGYFSPKGRTFTAWSREGGEPSVGKDRWFPTTDGRICFRAVWTFAGGAKRDVTCFSHRYDDTSVYQRREPGGEWYVFDDRRRFGDEYAKLVRGDRASLRYDVLLAEINESTR